MPPTTQLLPTIRLSAPRDRLTLALIVAGLVLFAVCVALGRRPAEPPLHPRIAEQLGYIIITATPAPTATAAPPPEPVIIVQTVEVEVDRYIAVQAAPREEPPAAQPATEQPPEPTAEPPAPTALPEPGEPGFRESFVDPPRCSPFVGYLPGSPCYDARP